MKKTKLFLLFAIFYSGILKAQVGINTTNPQALMDITVLGTTPGIKDGILIPRLSTLPIAEPGMEQDGMLIFLKEEIQLENAAMEMITYPRGFYFWNFDQLKWEKLITDKNRSFQVMETSELPDSIEDDIFRTGIISIGEQEDAAQMSVFVNDDTANLTGKPRKALLVVNSHPSSGASYHTFGIDVENESNANGKTYGIRIKNSTATDTMKYGLYNVVSSAGDGIHFGIYNETNQGSTSLNDIYGVYNIVGKTHGAESFNYGLYSTIGGNTSAGTIYGLYSQAEGTAFSDVYAGYFLGKVSIGTISNGLDNADNYILPISKGAEGEIMKMGINGQAEWVPENTKAFLTVSVPTTTLTLTSSMSTIRIKQNVDNILFPDPSTLFGKTYTILNAATVAPSTLSVSNSSQILNGFSNATVNLLNAEEKIIVQSDGSNWIVIGN